MGSTRDEVKRCSPSWTLIWYTSGSGSARPLYCSWLGHSWCVEPLASCCPAPGPGTIERPVVQCVQFCHTAAGTGVSAWGMGSGSVKGLSSSGLVGKASTYRLAALAPPSSSRWASGRALSSPLLPRASRPALAAPAFSSWRRRIRMGFDMVTRASSASAATMRAADGRPIRRTPQKGGGAARGAGAPVKWSAGRDHHGRGAAWPSGPRHQPGGALAPRGRLWPGTPWGPRARARARRPAGGWSRHWPGARRGQAGRGGGPGARPRRVPGQPARADPASAAQRAGGRASAAGWPRSRTVARHRRGAAAHRGAHGAPAVTTLGPRAGRWRIDAEQAFNSAAQVLSLVDDDAAVSTAQQQHRWPTRTRDIRPTVGQAPIAPAGWYIVSRRELIVWAAVSEQRRRHPHSPVTRSSAARGPRWRGELLRRQACEPTDQA